MKTLCVIKLHTLDGWILWYMDYKSVKSAMCKLIVNRNIAAQNKFFKG